MRSIPLIGVFAATLCGASPAYADPIRITNGFVDESASDIMELLLHIPGGTIEGSSGTGTPDPLIACFPCTAGTVISLNALWDGIDVLVTRDGLTGAGTATLSFVSSTITVPSLGDERAFFTRPFDFTGSVTLPGGGDVLDLFGNGIATYELVGEPPEVDSSRLIYSFQQTDPVPEPATLLLLGSGAAGICGACRNRHAAQS